MRVVVGLGNPGEEYRRTRHNAGFQVVDVLAARAGACGPAPASVSPRDAWAAETRIAEVPVLLVKPLAYMNRSGPEVARALAASLATAADLVVIVDDVALDLGRIRVRERGRHGGHNGLRSIIETLGTDEFPRVRVGVRRGELPRDLADYVLAAPPEDEERLLREAFALAADAVECLLREGPAVAMDRFNGRRV